MISLSRKAQFIGVLCITAIISMLISHLFYYWARLAEGRTTYRRIGDTNGAQVFCAGSSLMQFGLAWPDISALLKQGIENWGIPGSSPDIWEISQKLATNSNLMIIGISVYDLNEYRICDSRARIVPINQTISDLQESSASWAFTRRILSQYPLYFLRKVFPTAGRSQAVLVGLRARLRQLVRNSSAADDNGDGLLLPNEAVLSFENSIAKISDWSEGKVLRRIALMRLENQGIHFFRGPKQLAFRRMLKHANKLGRIIVVVLPVSEAYQREFLSREVRRDFNELLVEAKSNFPDIQVVRLDKLAGLNSNVLFSDPVHLNGAGRRIATEAFFKELEKLNLK